MKAKPGFLRLAIIAAMTLSLSAVTTVALSADSDHDHHGTMELTLNNGSKWAIDAPLSQAMNNIASAMQEHVGALHSEEVAEHKYAKLAGIINDEVKYMIENCQLEPDADAQLHLIIADLMAGSVAMENATNSQDGAVRVLGALENYGNYFDDPSFKSVEH